MSNCTLDNPLGLSVRLQTGLPTDRRLPGPADSGLSWPAGLLRIGHEPLRTSTGSPPLPFFATPILDSIASKCSTTGLVSDPTRRHPVMSLWTPRLVRSSAAPALCRIASAGPSCRPQGILLGQRAASSSFSSSSPSHKPAAEPFRPRRQSAAEEAARAQALRQTALDRMARIKLEQLERERRATAPAAARTVSSSSSTAAGARERSRVVDGDGPDRPHPTVERLRRERERKRQAAVQQAEVLHEAPTDKAPWRAIVDWYWGASPPFLRALMVVFSLVVSRNQP